jgi:hypothetical protein
MRRLGPLWLHRAEHAAFLGVRQLGVLQVPRGTWGRRRLDRKLAGTRAAASTATWADLAHPLRRLPGGRAWSSWVDICSPAATDVEDQLRSRLIERLVEVPSRPASELLAGGCGPADLSSLDAPGVRWNKVFDLLASTHLPVSPGHGDLRPDNLGRDRTGRLVVIDWESFEPESSALLDLVHYRVERLPKAVTWADAIAPAALDGSLREIAGTFGVPLDNLLAVYSLHRVRRTRLLHDVAPSSLRSRIDAKHGRILARVGEVLDVW